MIAGDINKHLHKQDNPNLLNKGGKATFNERDMYSNKSKLKSSQKP